MWPEGTVHAVADRFLRLHDGSGTQRTYAYLLVDHLRWLERECLAFTAVQLRDLERYMVLVGAEVRMPLGEPWRVGKRPCVRSALSTAAALAACRRKTETALERIHQAITRLRREKTQISTWSPSTSQALGRWHESWDTRH